MSKLLEAMQASLQARMERAPRQLRTLQPTGHCQTWLFCSHAVPVIHDLNYKFEIGKGEILKHGKDAVVFATGTLVHESLEAAEILENENIKVYVVNIHTIKPIDKGLIIELAKKTNCVVTAEDHNIIGGLGGAVAEVLSENCPCRMKMIGLQDKYAESGKPDELYKKYGLDAESIAEEVMKFVSKKK